MLGVVAVADASEVGFVGLWDIPYCWSSARLSELYTRQAFEVNQNSFKFRFR